MTIVQPSVYTLRAVCTLFAAIAVFSTLARLHHRHRQRRLWIDDAWALLSLLSQLALIIGLWVRTDAPGVGPLNEPREARVIAYWICALSFTFTLWAARMSMLYSIIRITPSLFKVSRYTNWLIFFFLATWTALVLQKTIICAHDVKWVKLAKPQCPLGQRVAILELCTDFVADAILLVLPIRLITNISTPFSQRRLLLAVFSASILTTLTSVVHAAYLILVEGLIEALTANVEASVALLVANLAVLVTWIYSQVTPEEPDSNIQYATWTFSSSADGSERRARSGGRKRAKPEAHGAMSTIHFANGQQSVVPQSVALDDLRSSSPGDETKTFGDNEHALETPPLDSKPCSPATDAPFLRTPGPSTPRTATLDVLPVLSSSRT